MRLECDVTLELYRTYYFDEANTQVILFNKNMNYLRVASCSDTCCVYFVHRLDMWRLRNCLLQEKFVQVKILSHHMPKSADSTAPLSLCMCRQKLMYNHNLVNAFVCTFIHS